MKLANFAKIQESISQKGSNDLCWRIA